MYANRQAEKRGCKALITIPAIASNHFAGPFKGRLKTKLKDVLFKILEKHGAELRSVKVVYFDPFSRLEDERCKVGGINYLVRPLASSVNRNTDKPQLCPPQTYEEEGDDYSDCDLFSVVSWDHVSWPGNDYYTGARSTDDGVKAAATSSMQTLTGVEGAYMIWIS